MRRARARRVFALLAALPAARVEAHLVETGFGAYYDGLAHVALTPSDLLLLVAVALLAGLRGAAAARWTLLALPVAWLIGGALGAGFPSSATLPVLTTLTFGVAGALVAINLRLHGGAVAVLATVAGLVHGYVNGATMAPGGASPLALAGAVSAVFCLVAILSAQVTVLPVGWPRVAVRVAGSWIAAAAVLMLGWLARGAA